MAYLMHLGIFGLFLRVRGGRALGQRWLRFLVQTPGTAWRFQRLFLQLQRFGGLRIYICCPERGTLPGANLQLRYRKTGRTRHWMGSYARRKSGNWVHFLRLYESMRCKHEEIHENEQTLKLSGMDAVIQILANDFSTIISGMEANRKKENSWQKETVT